MRILLILIAMLALQACERKLTEAELKQQLAERQAQSAEKTLGDKLTYKTVCLNGILYYASQVKTYDGQFGIERQFWVIGGPVVNAEGAHWNMIHATCPGGEAK